MDDAELTAVVRAWWEEVDRLNSSPLPAGSLEAFQGAIRQRIAEQSERMRVLPRDISSAISKIPEFSMAEKMAREIARSNALLDLAGHNSALAMAILPFFYCNVIIADGKGRRIVTMED